MERAEHHRAVQDCLRIKPGDDAGLGNGFAERHALARMGYFVLTGADEIDSNGYDNKTADTENEGLEPLIAVHEGPDAVEARNRQGSVKE
jgi:hypothetical protein